MGKKLAVTVGAIYKLVKKAFFTGEDLLHHKVKKAFLTKDGVHRLVYSSGIKWAKYSCYTVEVPTSYTQVSSSGNWSIGDTRTTRHYSLSYHTGYYFSSFDGFVGTGYDGAESWEEVPQGTFYRLSNEIVWKMLSCTPIEDGSSAFVEVTWECVGLCEAETETVYKQGSILYGTLEAEEGALPETGELIKGSPTGEYCVLLIAGVYYYYKVDTTITPPQPITSNFTLANGSVLITYDGKVFAAK